MTAPHQIALFAEPVREWVPFGTVECGECDDPESQMCADGDGKAWRRIVIGATKTIEEA